MSPKPTVLVLGGVGFIGRKFVAYLTEHDLASEIRVIDKVLPQTAYLNKRCTAAFDQVEFMQGNLSSQGKKSKKRKKETQFFSKEAERAFHVALRVLLGSCLVSSFFLLLSYTLDQ